MSSFQGKLQCCILGIGQLFSWNTILTISDYYYQIFPDYHPARILTLVYQPFVLVTICVLVSMNLKSKHQRRILLGYSLFVTGTFLLIVLDLANKGKGGLLAYLVLCSISACFGVANAQIEGAMIGELSHISPDLLQSFAAGLGLSGAITSALRLITKSVFEKSPDGLRKGALLFLAFSGLIELVCVFIYGYTFPRLQIVKNYRAQSQTTHMENSEESGVSKIELMRQNIDKMMSFFLIYALTLSIYPGFLYENTGKHQLGSWYPLVLVTCFNVCDGLSRYITLINQLKTESGKWIVVYSISRLLFVPAFHFTAKYADQGWMIFLTSFLGITNGYLTVCTLTAPPKRNYNVSEANELGNILVASMLVGIFGGVCLSWLWCIAYKISF